LFIINLIQIVFIEKVNIKLNINKWLIVFLLIVRFISILD
jgi:hypothetical protein